MAFNMDLKYWWTLEYEMMELQRRFQGWIEAMSTMLVAQKEVTGDGSGF